MPAPFVWYDVTSSEENADSVREFYSSLLGWTAAADTNPGPYHSWMVDGEQPWSAIVTAEGATSDRWIPYVQVDDLDTAVDKATKLGATVVAGKTDGPAGAAVTVADPGGALLALWVPHPASS